MLTRENTYQGLTRLTRMAQELGEAGEGWLQQVFARRLGQTAEWAVEIVAETGDPIGRVLARHLVETEVSSGLVLRLLERCQQPEVSRSVPLRELALVVTRMARGGETPIYEEWLAETKAVHEQAVLSLQQRASGDSESEDSAPPAR